MLRLGSSAMFLSLCLMASPIHAQPNPISLDYSASPECPDASRLSDEIAARLGYAAVTPNASRTARVRIFPDGAEHVAMVELDGTASRSFRSGDCADLVATIASALATELDARAAMASAPVSASAVTPGTVRLRVRAEEPNLELHRVASQQTAVIATSRGTAHAVGWSFDPICAAPCDVAIAPGTHRLAVSRDDGSPTIVSGNLRIEQDSDLSLRYVSREIERIVGWATFLGGAGISTGLIIAGTTSNTDGDAGTALIVSGSIVAAGSLAVGLFLAWLSDIAEIDIQPLRF